MTTSFLLLLASTLPSSPIDEHQSPFDHALSDQSCWVVRAQSPQPMVMPPANGSSPYYGGTAPGTSIPSYGSPTPGMDPFASPAYPAPLQDPWSSGTTPYAVPGQPMQPYQMYGMNGPQPKRFGWTARYDVFYIPGQGTDPPSTGDFEIFGADFEKEYTKPIFYNWSLAMAPQFNYRSWAGPTGTPTTDMPGNAYRFGLGLKLQSPTVGGWTWELGFNPAVGTDMNSTLTSDAWMWDGHLVAFWQTSPQWMWALGAFYWDRVDDIVLPYAGFVWTPNDIWEFRLVFPKPRISAFIGTPWGIPTWLYVSGEYHVESYQIDPALFVDETRVQLRDWRIMGGLRWETGTVTSFAEAGYVLGRDVKYSSIGNKYDIDSGFIGRIGLRY